MVKCDGTERHSHYKISTSTLITHVHEHSINEKDFNRLHHHPPVEHDSFSVDYLESTIDSLTLEY